MSLWRALHDAKALRPLDDALARTLQRLDPSTPDEVLAAAALASLAVAQGHAAFDIANPRQLVDADIAWPDAKAWAGILRDSPFVAVPDAPEEIAHAAPLAFEHGLLYLRRYREYERRLALQLRRIAAQAVEGDIASVAELFARLFPLLPAGEGVKADDRQARAAALALRRALLLVTGGPGTGKTTTIARLLALRIAQAQHANAAAPRTVKIREHGVRYEVNFEEGHKTGFFCDQRENRRGIARFTKDARVLDLCCYTGGFSLNAKLAGDAAEVPRVDLDEVALAQDRRNANLNQARLKFVHADAFAYARQMQQNGEKWDVVVLDPPKFIFTRDAASRNRSIDLPGRSSDGM